MGIFCVWTTEDEHSNSTAARAADGGVMGGVRGAATTAGNNCPIWPKKLAKYKIFIDKVSGEPLFDTRDRFNSGTGWLSFTQPVKGSVYEKPDNRYGMRRVEIRAIVSDIHLGHVFDDGPNGQPRYCINATVLEFKPRNDASRKNI